MITGIVKVPPGGTSSHSSWPHLAASSFLLLALTKASRRVVVDRHWAYVLRLFCPKCVHSDICLYIFTFGPSLGHEMGEYFLANSHFCEWLLLSDIMHIMNTFSIWNIFPRLLLGTFQAWYGTLSRHVPERLNHWNVSRLEDFFLLTLPVVKPAFPPINLISAISSPMATITILWH